MSEPEVLQVVFMGDRTVAGPLMWKMTTGAPPSEDEMSSTSWWGHNTSFCRFQVRPCPPTTLTPRLCARFGVSTVGGAGRKQTRQERFYSTGVPETIDIMAKTLGNTSSNYRNWVVCQANVIAVCYDSSNNKYVEEIKHKVS